MHILMIAVLKQGWKNIVAIGFQHLVANMFAIPAAMFEGANISVLQFIQNMGTVFLGNFVGAVTLVSALYTFAYKK